MVDHHMDLQPRQSYCGLHAGGVYLSRRLLGPTSRCHTPRPTPLRALSLERVLAWRSRQPSRLHARHHHPPLLVAPHREEQQHQPDDVAPQQQHGPQRYEENSHVGDVIADLQGLPAADGLVCGRQEPRDQGRAQSELDGGLQRWLQSGWRSCRRYAQSLQTVFLTSLLPPSPDLGPAAPSTARPHAVNSGRAKPPMPPGHPRGSARRHRRRPP